MFAINQLDEWWATGRLVVTHPTNKATVNEEQLFAWIEQNELIYRNQLPDTPPEVNLPWAGWACRQMVRATQLLVYRELGEEFIETGLEDLPVHLVDGVQKGTAQANSADEPGSLSTIQQVPCPTNDPVQDSNKNLPIQFVQQASIHYSVDLFFRFLPDFVRLAKAASMEDPLIDRLKQWAVIWPVSGMGVPNVNHSQTILSFIYRDPFLSILMEDRAYLHRQSIPKLCQT